MFKICTIRPLYLELVTSSTIVISVFIIIILFIFNSIELERARTDLTYCLLVINPEVRATLDGLYEEYKAPVIYHCVHCETIC